jgi:hypothetical protein
VRSWQDEVHLVQGEGGAREHCSKHREEHTATRVCVLFTLSVCDPVMSITLDMIQMW